MPKMKSLTGANRCRRKFLRFFRRGFQDPKYLDWERDYKVETHERWLEALDRPAFRKLLRAGEFEGLDVAQLCGLGIADRRDCDDFRVEALGFGVGDETEGKHSQRLEPFIGAVNVLAAIDAS